MTTTTSIVADADVTGVEHWTHKGEVRLFLWEKYVGAPEGKPAVLFVHGSSMASQPTFDLRVPGRPDSSVMDWFARRGFVCWSVDMEGYGRSDKHRDIFCDIANGADDLAAATDYIQKTHGIASFATYGISSGALRAALFAQRHPDRVSRLALDAFVWTGEGAPTLVQRRKKLPEFQASKRRPIDRAFVYSIFERDHPNTAEKRVVDALRASALARIVSGFASVPLQHRSLNARPRCTCVGNTPIHTSLPGSQSAFTGGAEHQGMTSKARNQWSIECGWRR